MNILILCDKFLPVSEQFIYNQIRSLDGHRLHLFSRKKVAGSHESVEFANDFFWYKSWPMRLAFKLQKKKQKEYPAIVQKALQKFVITHRIDLIYIHYGTTAVNYYSTLRASKLPVVCAFHGFDASRKLRESVYSTKLRDLSKAMRVLTVPSRYLGQRLIEAGISPDLIRVIPYGADIDKIKAIEPLPGRSADKLRLIHAGRLVAKKGVPDLVRVFLDLCKEYQNIELLIVGGGEEEELVTQLAEGAHYSDAISMTGPVSHEKLIGYLKSSDIFILNSRESRSGETEGLPNSIMEAMASGLAVVSTDHSGIPEILSDHENGLIVAPENNLELKNGLKELIGDEKLRKRLSENGYSTVIKNFSFEAMKRQISAVINEVGT